MTTIDDKLKLAVWEKARCVDGLDCSMFRKDACGAMIMYDKYGMQNPFGWVIDHVFPEYLGGDDNIDNLRALHYLNNRSKANDYPSYTAAVRFDADEKKNIEDERALKVNDKMRSKLKKIYDNA